MSHDVQSEVDQIINNVTKSSNGIFHLLQGPGEVGDSTTTATENGLLRMKPISYSNLPESNGYHRVKKLQSKRERNAIRSAFHMRMIAKGEYCGPPSRSSSSGEDSNDVNVFDNYQKRFDDMTNTPIGLSKKLFSTLNQYRHKPGYCSHSSDEMSDTFEPFEGFPLRSEHKQEVLSNHRLLEEQSAKKRKFNVGAHTGSLSDNYLTSVSQIDALEQGPQFCCSSSEKTGHLNTVIRINHREEMAKVEKEYIKQDEPGAVDVQRNENMEIKTLQNLDDMDLYLTQKLLKTPDELSKTIVEEEILKNYVIKCKTGFEEHGYHRCMACKDRFLLDTGLQEHLNRTTVHIDLNCQYCNTNLEFFNRCNLLQHLKDHHVKPTVEYLNQFTIKRPIVAQEYLLFEYGSSSDDEHEHDMAQENSDSNNCNNSLNETKFEQNNPEIACGGSEPEAQLPPTEAISKARTYDGAFKCLKCVDYVTTDEDEFYAHVKSTHTWSNDEIQQLFHKNGDRSEFWCPECNDAFVTKLALTMHLKVTHEFLHDISMYLEKLGYEGKIPLLENQCEVCFLMFQESQELQKHMRTHGLAFLRLQKRQKLQNGKKC